MCSRYTYNRDDAKIKRREKIEVYGCVPRANIRPTDLGPVIIPEHESYVCREMNWGWRVSWDKQPLINAKSETLLSLPTFKPHLQNRCLLLADGFYEKGIQFIQPGQQPFCLAALWRAEGAGNRFVMLTTTPNESVSPYHHRMPFILRAEQCEEWLSGDWEQVLSDPDWALLEKIQNQPELF